MPTGKHLSREQKLVFAIAPAVAIIIGVVISLGWFGESSEPIVGANEPTYTDTPSEPFVAPLPTDTVRVGTVTFDTPGLKQDTLYLVYEEPGKPAVTKQLIIDEHSYCNIGSGGLPCMMMSVQYSMAFGGKRALIDGNAAGEAIVVRRIRVLDENETPRVMPAGTVYVPWAQARAMILGCEIQELMQSHEGLVFMTAKDGKKMTAVEPVIDEVFTVANDATAVCGNIRLGTE